MSKRDKEKAPRHVRLYHWFLKTEAWQSLSPNARALYVEIVTRYNGSNNGRIGFSARDAGKALHTSKDTGARSLVELQDRGFIVLTKRSGFSLKTKTATEWLLTEFCSDINGQFATKDFMRWSVARSAEKQNTVPVVIPSVPVVRQYGPCGETVVAGTVPVVRLMSAKKTVPRSDYRDTYSIPGAQPRRGESQQTVPLSPTVPSQMTKPPSTLSRIESFSSGYHRPSRRCSAMRLNGCEHPLS